MLTIEDRDWLQQLFDEKFEELYQRLVGAKRAEERRRLNANGNIPSAIANLDIQIEELANRVGKLERK